MFAVAVAGEGRVSQNKIGPLAPAILQALSNMVAPDPFLIIISPSYPLPGAGGQGGSQPWNVVCMRDGSNRVENLTEHHPPVTVRVRVL